VLRISIKAFGVQDDGTETPEPILSIERMHVTEVYPMLHYVFFDDGSSVIPARYNHETLQSKKQFSEKAFYTASALDIHHHILDILGSRLTENPHATITLVGTRSTHSPLDSASGTEVSAGRAEAAAKYLRDVWGIANARLHIRSRDLPEAPSDDRNPFGEAENRRVEIVPSSPEIIAPLWTERIERVATPPHIDFTPEIVTSAGIRSATIIVKQRDCILQTFDALTGGSTGEYIWTLGGSSMPGRSDSLTYTFDVIDSLGDSASANGVIHLRQETHDISKHTSDTSLDKDLERYSLILFDYSSSQLDKKQSERILRDMASAIREASQVTLTGHTDRTGDDAFNYRLARQRVSRAGEMLSEELRRMGKERPAMVVESHGSRDLLFDNGIPEGRVLSRTVRALIENEIK
jgi:outer membrane protein OmpA-like peptidoglycan-associated protein